MCLTAEQHSQIARAYEKAAADETLPNQLRTVFAKKAKWFRMLCQIEVAKLTAGLVPTVVASAPERRYLSLAEKLSRARRRKHDLIAIVTENSSAATTYQATAHMDRVSR